MGSSGGAGFVRNPPHRWQTKKSHCPDGEAETEAETETAWKSAGQESRCGTARLQRATRAHRRHRAPLHTAAQHSTAQTGHTTQTGTAQQRRQQPIKQRSQLRRSVSVDVCARSTCMWAEEHGLLSELGIVHDATEQPNAASRADAIQLERDTQTSAQHSRTIVGGNW